MEGLSETMKKFNQDCWGPS